VKVFVDTSAFCALTIPKDQHNSLAKSLYKRILKDRATFFTSNYVLDEVYTLLKMRSSHSTAVKFMDQMEKSNITIRRVSEDIEKSSRVICKRFSGQKVEFY